MIEHDGCEMCKHFNDNEYRILFIDYAFANNEVDCNSPCYDCVSAHKRRMLEDKFEPMTNGDRIRNMSDEELAEFVRTYDFSCEYNCPAKTYGCFEKC